MSHCDDFKKNLWKCSPFAYFVQLQYCDAILWWLYDVHCVTTADPTHIEEYTKFYCWYAHALLLCARICNCFYLALWYFQYSVTGEQSTNSMRSVFAKPNHQWKVCSLLSYSYTLKHMFPMHVLQISAHIIVNIYWWSPRRWRVRFFVGIFGVFSGDLGVLLSCKITRGMILVVGKVNERV